MNALAHLPHLTMSAVMSQRPVSDGLSERSARPPIGEMAVWDPTEDLSDPERAFQRTDLGVMRLLGGVGLAGLLAVALVAIEVLLAH